MSATSLNRLPQVTSWSSTSVDPVILCAADERYAMPLAVTLLSAAIHLKVGHQLHAFVVDGGLSEVSRQKLADTLDGQPIHLNWVSPGDVDLRDLKISHHISHTAYLRLLADRWLPADCEKALYLDSDLLVLASLTELWEQSLGDLACLAVPDIACPYVNARLGSQNFRKSCPYLASLQPIPNYSELGVDERALYFNSGVMVLNIGRWRTERLADRLLDVLRTNAQHVWCWDQYALNAVLHRQWRRLPLNWNVGAHAFEYPDGTHSPLEISEFHSMISDPAILHFTTEFKPWDYHCHHPHRDLFFQYVDQTAWAGWRPARPPFRWREWWNRRALAVTKLGTQYYRRWITARG